MDVDSRIGRSQQPRRPAVNLQASRCPHTGGLEAGQALKGGHSYAEFTARLHGFCLPSRLNFKVEKMLYMLFMLHILSFNLRDSPSGK